MIVHVLVLRFCLGLAAVVLTAASPAAQHKVELLYPGTHLGGSNWPKTGETWLGLYRTNPGFRLAQARIKVERVPNACAGSATSVSADTTVQPYLLVRGGAFRPGPVDTAFAGNQYLYPGQDLPMKMEQPERWSSIRALGSAFARPGDILVKNYTVALSGVVFLRLDRMAMENTANLQWAGDLDRDGKLDLLYRLPVGDYGERYVLFLSSAATPPALVEQVAAFDVPDC